jgi:hypothetical protein
MENYQKLMAEELGVLKDYVKQLDESMKYAAQAIAGGGVDVLHDVRTSATAAEDETGRLGPTGKSNAASWLRANSNEDALHNVLKDDDEGSARVAVQKFVDDKGTQSDISGIRSALIREPLEVVAAGRAWRSDIVRYQRDLEQRSSAVTAQSRVLSRSTTNLSTVSGDDSGKSEKSDLTSSASSMKQLADLSTSASGLAAKMNGGGTASPASLAGAAGDLLSGATAASPRGNGGTSSASFDGTSSDKAPGASTSPASPEGKDPTSARVDAGTVTGGGTPSERDHPAMGEKVASGSSEGLGGLRAALTRSLAGAAPVGGKDADPARAPASEKAPAAGAESFSTTAPVPGVPGFSSSLASANAASLEALFNQPPGATLGVPEPNESAVKSIMGEWEKSFAQLEEPGSTAAGTVPAAGFEGVSLFSRVHLTHERAQKRGGVARIPVRL